MSLTKSSLLVEDSDISRPGDCEQIGLRGLHLFVDHLESGK